MTYALSFLIGMLICWLIARREISDLKFDKEMLLDFNEKLIRERDELEQKSEVAITSYTSHLNNHCCYFKEVEDEVLEAEFVIE